MRSREKGSKLGPNIGHGSSPMSWTASVKGGRAAAVDRWQGYSLQMLGAWRKHHPKAAAAANAAIAASLRRPWLRGQQAQRVGPRTAAGGAAAGGCHEAHRVRHTQAAIGGGGGAGSSVAYAGGYSRRSRGRRRRRRRKKKRKEKKKKRKKIK